MSAEDPFSMSRRDFLATSACGLGTLALASLFDQEGLLASESKAVDSSLENPLSVRAPHFAPKAKRCIFIFLEGGPSQMDLFDPKPALNQYDGDSLPQSMLKEMEFAFIEKEGARIMGSPRKFSQHGESGMKISDLLPHLSTCVDDMCLIRSMHTDQFNHLPGQLMLNCGVPMLGRPSMGSWLTYGLGTESQNLPGYVVMTNLGRGLPGGTATWSSGFLPSSYEGVRFRDSATPVLNLGNPPGIDETMQHYGVNTLNDLNRLRYQHVKDPEIAGRIKSYELAFQMQSAAPELMDLSGESQKTIHAYGLEREEPEIDFDNRGGRGMFRAFSRNCLLARRLVERGVRFVNLIHASWDHHSHINRELEHNCLMVDQPIAALLKDLKRRGLLDETLVVWGSEFGRTALGENRPGFDKATGRDHHPNAFSVWMAGGGVKGGQVIGETDEFAWNVVRDPVSIHDLHATILHLFGMDHERLTYRFKGRDFRLTDVHGKVKKEMVA